jgi:hypothetical protein
MMVDYLCIAVYTLDNAGIEEGITFFDTQSDDTGEVKFDKLINGGGICGMFMTFSFHFDYD